MRVMVIVKATPPSEAGELPSEQLLAEMGRFNEELVKNGMMQAGEGLKPSREGVRVRFSGSSRTVSNGPFPETEELIAGFWLWQVASLQEAIEWVKRCPNPMMEDSDVEIRPLYKPEDFAASDPRGEWRNHEQGLRATVAMQDASVQPYLFFAGRCEEALEFYEQALDATVDLVMRFSESPDPVPEGMLQPGFENKVMHAAFRVGTTLILASDGCDDKTKFDGFRLTLQVSTEATAQRVFAALADGGRIDMPIGPTFWSPCYGMVTDKFNVGWMVMVPGPTP